MISSLTEIKLGEAGQWELTQASTTHALSELGIMPMFQARKLNKEKG